MRKLLTISFSVLFSFNAFATSLVIPNQNEQPGGVIKSTDWNSNFQAIAQWANNNNIDGSTNIATAGVTTSSISNGAVTNAKIDNTAGIYTYGDVFGSALTTLSGINSSAGEIPTANLATGTGNAATILRGDQTWATLNSQVTLYNYGTSTSASTTPTATAAVKIVTGSAANTQNSGATTITNLPFSSSSSYKVTLSSDNNSAIICLVDSYISGSSFSFLSNGGGSAESCSWVAVGT